MITLDELDKLVRNEFTDNITLREWNRKKANLGTIYEPEYMNADTLDEVLSAIAADRVEWVETNGYIVTFDEDLAYFCWRCGCTLSATQDWTDGSFVGSFWLPETEEEYQTNLKEADAWWKEVMED